jgi:hypothetical protein
VVEEHPRVRQARHADFGVRCMDLAVRIQVRKLAGSSQ